MPKSKKPKNNDIKVKETKAPFLKKLVINKFKIKRYKNNYGANYVNDPKFFLKPFSQNKLKKISTDENHDILEDANKDIKKKKKKNLNFLYFILNVLVIGIVLWIQLSKESDPGTSILAILNANWWFLLLALSTVFIGMILDQIRFATLIHKATGVFRMHLAYKMAALGRYYDVITPLSTGGQPFQVLYTNRYGVKAGEGISVVMAKYIFYQIIYFVTVTFILFSNITTTSISKFMGSVSSGLATSLSWIGYSVLAVVIITITVISLNKRIGASIVVGILKLLSKIKIGKFSIIKDYKSTFMKVMRTVNVWQSTTRKYSKSFWVILINVFCSILYFFVSYSMPFFIYCAFEGWDPSAFITIITIAVMVDLSSAFNPIPMGIGTADLSFTALYALIFATAGAQIWALIIWRVLYYYIYLIQGFVVLTYDYVLGNKRLEKNKLLWTLPLKERHKYKKDLKNPNSKS